MICKHLIENIFKQVWTHFICTQNDFKLDEPDMQDTAGEAGTNS